MWIFLFHSAAPEVEIFHNSFSALRSSEQDCIYDKNIIVMVFMVIVSSHF